VKSGFHRCPLRVGGIPLGVTLTKLSNNDKQSAVVVCRKCQKLAGLLCSSPSRWPGPSQVHPAICGLISLQLQRPQPCSGSPCYMRLKNPSAYMTSYTKAYYFKRTTFLRPKKLSQRVFIHDLTLSSEKSMAILLQKDKNVK
jgi:hypothetical protein